jgi:hypothetical protein
MNAFATAFQPGQTFDMQNMCSSFMQPPPHTNKEQESIERFLVGDIPQLISANCSHVRSVQVNTTRLARLGKVTVTLAYNPCTVSALDVRSVAKQAFLDVTAGSQATYVLGYATQPFEEESDAGFGVTLGTVPPECQGHICWDTFQHGFCPRYSSCRWWHPVASNLVRVRVVLEADPLVPFALRAGQM